MQRLSSSLSIAVLIALAVVLATNLPSSPSKQASLLGRVSTQESQPPPPLFLQGTGQVPAGAEAYLYCATMARGAGVTAGPQMPSVVGRSGLPVKISNQTSAFLYRFVGTEWAIFSTGEPDFPGASWSYGPDAEQNSEVPVISPQTLYYVLTDSTLSFSCSAGLSDGKATQPTNGKNPPPPGEILPKPGGGNTGIDGNSCAAPSCPVPPIGCTYDRSTASRDAKGCPIGCGRISCEFQGKDGTKCPLIGCAPPENGCTYLAPFEDANGCPSCGKLQCERKKPSAKCTGDDQCAAGTHCSVADGDCLSACDDPTGPCMAVCAGYCVSNSPTR
jgi:hypothetical protein